MAVQQARQCHAAGPERRPERATTRDARRRRRDDVIVTSHAVLSSPPVSVVVSGCLDTTLGGLCLGLGRAKTVLLKVRTYQPRQWPA